MLAKKLLSATFVVSAVGKLYKSTTLYTTKADIVANATAISGGASITNEYLYFVPGGNETIGNYVFSSNGNMNDTTRYFYRSGSSWVQTSGSYGVSEFTLMIYGTDSTNYRLSPTRDFYLLSSSAGQTAATGTVPTLA